MTYNDKEKQEQLTLGQSRTQAWELALKQAENTSTSQGSMIHNSQWIFERYIKILRGLYPLNVATCELIPAFSGTDIKKQKELLQELELASITGAL